MASRIDLACQFRNSSIAETKVLEKPPVPTRPSSGKFHNRGSLFPSTYHNKIFQPTTQTTINDDKPENTCKELELHSSSIKDDSDQSSANKKIPSYCRRTQSAKARQRTKPSRPAGSNRPCTAEARSNRPRSAGARSYRPSSAGVVSRLKGSGYNATFSNEKVNDDNKQLAVIDLANEVTPDLFEIQKEKLLALPAPPNYDKPIQNVASMSFSRPSSASYDHEHSNECVCRTSTLSKDVEQRLKPSIYGLQKHRQVYGSAPDLSCESSEVFPYKMSQLNDGEDKMVSRKEVLNDKIRNLPHTLEPITPWLTDNVPQELIGVDPTKCLVFLPNVDYSSLPEVPEPHMTEEDLPYVKDVTTPRPWNPKKYPHPFNKQPVEEWVCKHSSHTASEEENLHWTTIYKKPMKTKRSFKLPRMRTADVIKKEINDLEHLLKGIGTQNSDCAMVRYQDDLSTLQEMLQVTMEKIPDRLKMPPPESPDRFGMNKVFKDHDTVIEEIQARVEECRLELAELEVEAGIESARQYFRKRSNSTL